MPYKCGLCEGAEPAAFLITPLSGADTMAVGQQCAPTALGTLLASYVGAEPSDLIAVIDTLLGGNGQSAEQVNLPTGYVYGPNGEDALSEDDIDAGLCGYIHDDWQHCHRKAKHSGKHGKAEARPQETAQPPPADIPPLAAQGAGEQ
jgi:hypothetical protein